VALVSQGLGDSLELFPFPLQDIDRLIALQPQAMVESAEKEVAL